MEIGIQQTLLIEIQLFGQNVKCKSQMRYKKLLINFIKKPNRLLFFITFLTWRELAKRPATPLSTPSQFQLVLYQFIILPTLLYQLLMCACFGNAPMV